jgi:hypothetical protein
MLGRLIRNNIILIIFFLKSNNISFKFWLGEYIGFDWINLYFNLIKK